MPLTCPCVCTPDRAVMPTRLPRDEIGSESVLHVYGTSQIKRAAYRCMGNGGVKVEALHLHLLGFDLKINV